MHLLSASEDNLPKKNLEHLIKAAIDAASKNFWNEAISFNKKILAFEKQNIEALNRLAKAYWCQGEFKKAQNHYKKVLEIDKYNIIARKNLEKISKSNGFKPNGHTNHLAESNHLTIFLQEPGKTKIINLLNLAPPSILAVLNCGDRVAINPKKHTVTIITADGTYLGALPDDLAHRLIAFIEGGNTYGVYVKCASPKTLTVIIQEIKRSTKFANQPSFQSQLLV